MEPAEAQSCTIVRTTYQQTFLQMLHSAHRHQLHTDVTLICEGHKIEVHRSILASLSPFFKDLLMTSVATDSVIILEGFKYDPILLLVNFLYQGVVEGSAEDLITVSEYAKLLHIEGLINSNCGRKKLQLQLYEAKQTVQIQLDNLESNGESNSDVESISDEEDLEIIYENTKSNNNLKGDQEVDDKTQLAARQVPSKRQRSQPEDLPPKSKKKPNDKTTGSGPQQTKQITCQLCPQTFNSRDELWAHRESHAALLQCGVCKRLLATKNSLKRHLQLHIVRLDQLTSTSAVSPESDLQRTQNGDATS